MNRALEPVAEPDPTVAAFARTWVFRLFARTLASAATVLRPLPAIAIALIAVCLQVVPRAATAEGSPAESARSVVGLPEAALRQRAAGLSVGTDDALVAVTRQSLLAAADLQAGQPASAVRHLQAAGAASPDPGERLRIVWELVGLGATDEAAGVLGEGVLPGPHRGSSACLRALLALRGGDRERCRQLLEQAGDQPRRLLVAAEVHAADGDLEKAIASIGEYLRLEPYHRTLSPQAYRLQAEWLEAAPRDLHQGPGDLYSGYGSAMLAWCLAWRSTDDELRAALVTARYAILFGHPTEAAALLTDVAQRFPEAAELQNVRAYALASIGRFDDAAKALRISEVGPTNFYRQATPAKIATLRGDHMRALDLWNGLLGEYPNAAVALREKALLLSSSPDDSLRNAQEGLSCIETANRITGDRVWDLWLVEACVHLERSEFKTALSNINRSLAASGASNRWHESLSNALQSRRSYRLRPVLDRDVGGLTFAGCAPHGNAIRETSAWGLAALDSLQRHRSEELTEFSAASSYAGYRACEHNFAAAIQAAASVRNLAASTAEHALIDLFIADLALRTPMAELRPLLNQIDESRDYGGSSKRTAALLALHHAPKSEPDMGVTMLRAARLSRGRSVSRRLAPHYGNGDIHEDLSRIHAALGEWTRALDAADKCLASYRVQESPFAADAWLLRARALVETGQPELARQNAAIAWRIDPDVRHLADVMSRIHLALHHLDTGRYWTERAIQAVGDDPIERAPLLARLAQIAQEQNQPDEMPRLLAEAVRIVPREPQVWREHEAVFLAHEAAARCLLRAGRDRDALQALDRALDTAVESPQTAILRVRLLACSSDDAVRDGAAAVRLADALQRVAGLDPALIAARACGLAETGDFAGAIASLKSARAFLNDDSPDASEFQRLETLFQQRQPDRRIPPLRVASPPATSRTQ